MQQLVKAYMAETVPSINVDIDVAEYCESLMALFGNETLLHRLVQIAMDGSQ